jgi:LysM repeat protein
MKRTIIGTVLLVLLALSLVGCQRPASTEPATLPTAGIALGTNLPFPVNNTEESSPLGDILSGTQTASALLTPATAVAATDVPTVAATAQTTSEATGTKTPIATATPGVPETWTLQAGEWPICIARRHNLDVGDFLSLNGMTMESRPAAGTVVKLPTNSSWSANYGSPALLAHPTTHTVVAGQTLYSIACKYGDVDPNDIIAANGLTEPVVLASGDVLDIP